MDIHQQQIPMEIRNQRQAVMVAGDPFASLPDHILHAILSLLRLKEAARMTLLSRSCKRAWQTLPIFDFYLRDFFPDNFILHEARLEALAEPNDWYLGFADSTLSRLREQRIPLPRLKIQTKLVENDRRSLELFDKWIGMALDDGAQKLYLDIDVMDRQNWPYTVPARVFTSGFIKHLTLIGSRLIAPLDAIGSVSLTSLQSLYFHDAPIDDGMLDKLLRGCPLLKNLGLYRCSLLKQILISSLRHLRRLVIHNDLCSAEFIEIDVLGLEDFEYSSTCARSGENDTTDIRLDRSPKLKHLKLCNNSIPQEWFQELIHKSVLLETLSIVRCRCFQRVQHTNPLLKEIEIISCHGLVDIEINAPQLSSFLYTSSQAILPQIRMTNSPSLFNCEARISSILKELNTNWFLELREFLMSCPFTCFSFSLGTQMGELCRAEQAIPPSPLKIDRLNLNVTAPPSYQVVVLDRLLSVCHPTTLCAGPEYVDHSFLKLLCEKLSKRSDEAYSCLWGYNKCWMHELKGVEIQEIMRSDIIGPLDWHTLFEQLPTLSTDNCVCFRLDW